MLPPFFMMLYARVRRVACLFFRSVDGLTLFCSFLRATFCFSYLSGKNQHAQFKLTNSFICRYKGFQRTHVTWSPTLNPAGIRVKMAQVFFETPELATTAKDALNGFTLKKGWQMSVVYI